MKTSNNRTFLLFAIAGGLSVFFSAVGRAAGEEVTLALPPASIAQWYKPENGRQVWLHNMFKLRRELQAVEEYLEPAEPELLKKWAGRFAGHYREVGEMVPEWQGALDLEALAELEQAIDGGDASAARGAISSLKESCGNCHKQYRAVTALLYRTPDYADLRVGAQGGEGGRAYGTAMKSLSRQVNRIKIAFEDGRQTAALGALEELRAGLEDLRSTCAGCHKDDYPVERILGAGPQGALDGLEKGIVEGDEKTVGRNLGEAAVTICARCHAIHRVAFDMAGDLER